MSQLFTNIRIKRHGEDVKSDNPKTITEFKSIEDLNGLGYDNDYQDNIVESVNNVIKKSPNLIYALEGIAAMYCIPSSHIMRDDDLGSIRVVGDNIIAPGNVGAVNNKEAIIRAIGAVLDKKSDDVDHKIDHHHHHHCHELFKEKPQLTPDPNKGEVVGRYLDDDNNEIIVYNTGIVDAKSSPTTFKKIQELRAQGLIPDYDMSVLQGGCSTCGSGDAATASYFADVDDITSNVDMSSDTAPAETSTTQTSDTAATNNEFGTTNISSSINESKEIVEACAVFENTHNLGYELLSLQGFDFVKPTTQVIKEAAEGGDDNAEVIIGGGIDPHEFEFMRFDNSHIIKAVKFINDWVEKNGAAGIGSVPFNDLYKSDEFSFAIDELSEQFDARIRVHYRPSGANVYTYCDETKISELRKIKISKTKGFQFSGNPIDITIVGKNTIRDLSLGKVEFTGQTIISILLHEIFHNAMWVWKINDTEFSASFALTLQLASQEKSARKRRKIVTNYVNMLDSWYGVNLNKVKKKILIKRITAFTAIGNETNAQKLKKKFKSLEFSNKNRNKEAIPDKDVLDTVNMYEKYMKRYERHMKKKTCILNMILGTAGIVGAVFLGKAASEHNGKKESLGFELAASLTGATGVILLVSGITGTLERVLINEARKNYESSKDLEEQWCDMFSAMYKLPVTFKIMTNSGRAYTDDKISKDIIERFNRVDIEIHKLILDCHPSGAERNYQAVKIANNLLKEKELLDPEIQKYLEWISEAYKQTGDQKEIEDIYNKSVFDPKEAEDLDEHLAHLIDISDAPLTEYTEYDVNDWGILME